MNVIDWFRTRKQLVKANKELKDLINKRLKDVIKLDKIEQNKIYLLQIPNIKQNDLNALQQALEENNLKWTPPQVLVVNSYVELTELQENTILNMAKEIRKKRKNKQKR